MTVDTVMWTPVMHGDAMFYHCFAQFLGLTGQGTSHTKHMALVYALRELADNVESNPGVCPK